MVKVVWISTIIFSETPDNWTGTWLKPLAKTLLESGNVELFNITHSKNIKGEIKLSKECGIYQYLLPYYKSCEINILGHNLQKILNEIDPDIVQIWGTESRWSTLYEKGYIKYPCFIDIQGILSTSFGYYKTCLSLWDRIKVSCRLYDVIHPFKSYPYSLFDFYRGGKREVRVLQSFKHISVQSDFSSREISKIAPNACQHRTGIILREEFYKCEPWHPNNNNNPIVFTCASSAMIPYKGLYVLLKAIGELKKKYPEISLKIAGDAPSWNNPNPGYVELQRNIIEKYNLWDNLHFLGRLTAPEIISNLQKCDVCVVPSFVETYCLSAAEGLMVGTPCIISNAAALPELAKDGEEALFYKSKDYKELASLIEYVLSNLDIALKLSHNGRIRRLRENDPNHIAKIQLSIYKEIIADNDE